MPIAPSAKPRCRKRVADAFHAAGLFRILLPRELSGGGLTIPDMLRLIEEVSRIDASPDGISQSAAAVRSLGSSCRARPTKKYLHDPRGVTCGSLNPMTSQAIPIEGGWRFSGKATNASGSAHATYLMAAALVLRDGAPQIVDGVPILRAGFFPIKHATILKTWSTAGMRGTGSNDCVFENVFVPDEFTFDWLNARPTWQRGPFADIPMQLQMAGGLAAVVLGTARHAIDTLNEIAQAKIPAATQAPLRERPLAQIQFAQAEGLLNARRAHTSTSATTRSGARARPAKASAVRDFAHVRLGIVTAVKLALQAVDLVADAAGMNSAQTSCPIERCWRDAHTASQHVLMNTARFGVVGRGAVRTSSRLAGDLSGRRHPFASRKTPLATGW